MKIRRVLLSSLWLIALLIPQSLFACAVCMGGSDSQVASAMNAAIFLLLGFVGTTLTGAGGFAFYLFRRSRLPPPPSAEFHD